MPDPSHTRWAGELDTHDDLWTRIHDNIAADGRDVMTLTCEIGPPPYTPVDHETGEPMYDFRAQNRWLRDHVREMLDPTTPAKHR